MPNLIGRVSMLMHAGKNHRRDRDPAAWELLNEELQRLHGEDPHERSDTSASEASRLLRYTKEAITTAPTSIEALPARLIERIGESSIRSTYRQYRSGSYLQTVAKSLGAALTVSPSQSTAAAVNNLIGEDIVPAMTVHKSKGLEFHTVIFVGLEDAQLWNFANQSEEEVRGFFVAFSRAIHRVVFTFSDLRDGRRGREQQNKSTIRDLYAILHEAGVSTVNCRTN